MSGGSFTEATRLAATIAEAMAGSPVYRQSVWQYLSGAGHVNLNRLWQSGEGDIVEALKRGGPPDSGTPTGPALSGLAQEMLNDRRADEALVLLSITDGEPFSRRSVQTAVNKYGERIAIVGVYVDAGNEAVPYWYRGDEAKAQYLAQRNETRIVAARQMEDHQYGEGKVITFDGDWSHLAEDIGSLVGRALAGTLE